MKPCNPGLVIDGRVDNTCREVGGVFPSGEGKGRKSKTQFKILPVKNSPWKCEVPRVPIILSNTYLVCTM